MQVSDQAAAKDVGSESEKSLVENLKVIGEENEKKIEAANIH